MIDYAKFESFTYPVSLLKQNHLLNFTTELDLKTGSTLDIEKAKYHQLTIEIKKGKFLVIKGSLHKCFNSIQGIFGPNQTTLREKEKGYNGNQFGLKELRFVFNYLLNHLNLDLRYLRLSNLEFGLNVHHDYKTSSILPYLIMHKGRSFRQHTIDGYYQCIHSQYIIKCYNKALQYGLKDEVVRIELKFTKMEKLNNLGVEIGAHLLYSDTLQKLGDSLLSTWNEILMFDYTTTLQNLTLKQRNDIVKYKSQNYWLIDLKPNRRARPKKYLADITRNHSEEIQRYFSTQIFETWNQLTQNCVMIDQHFNMGLKIAV